MSRLLKNLIIALGITILLGIVYYFFVVRGEGVVVNDVSPEALSATDPDIGLRIEKILADTQKIDTYRLDVSILEDERFKTLKDLRAEISDVDTGRENPFAPVE